MFRRLTAIVLSVVMIASLTACGGKGTQQKEQSDTLANGKAPGKYDTLVIGTSELNGIFSPFFYKTSYDYQVTQMVGLDLCRLNDKNELIPWAGSISSEELKNGTDVQTKYTVKLKQGLKFSDGSPVTIDDVIFNWYVYADPMYDGMSIFHTLDIVGLQDYYYDSPDYSKQMEKFKKQANAISDQEVKKFITQYTEEQIQAYGAPYLNETHKLGADPKAVTFEADVKKAYLAMNLKEWDVLKAEAIAEKYESLEKSYVKGNLEDGVDVDTISGIQKVDDYTATVLLNGVNISADRIIAEIPIMPEHYYGVGQDGTKFSKGNLAMVRERNQQPMSGGPFIYESYKNNIVTLKANPDYFKGAPKIPTLKFQVVSDNNKVDSVILGDIDITDPSASKEVMKQLEDNKIAYSLVDNNGFGYINISAKRIKDKNIRKGLMHLMNRAPAINAYYGELATILERPMTSTLAEYPTDAKEYYGYDPKKAMEYFEKAGYHKNKDGKLVNQAGKQLSIECAIGQLSSHPAAGILTQMKSDLDQLGASFKISDTDFNVLSDRVQNDDIDMWVMAWGNANDCDITQMYDSKMTAPGASNRIWIQDKKLDRLLKQTRQTLDLEERKKLVAQELDIIMDWAVTMPIYQRKNLFIYNPEVVKVDTLPKNITTYWTYVSEIEKLELN